MATGSPYAVAPGRVRKPDGSPLRGVHPVLPGLDRARLAPPGEARRHCRLAGPRRSARCAPADAGGHRCAGVLIDPTTRARRGRGSGDLAGLPAAQRRSRGPTVRAGRDVRHRQLPGPTRQARSPWHQPDVALPEVGLHPPAHDAGRPRRARFARAPLRTGENSPGGSSTPTSCSTDPHRCGRPSTRWSTCCAWDTGRVADERLAAWKAGRTGYPYIDAGMRQLLAEGWVHNRVRMGVASFLIKDLHLPWQLGARVLPRAPGRRRLRLEQPRLAMGGRLRAAGRAVLPDLQSRRPGREVRPATAITSAGSYPNCAASPARPCTGHGSCPPDTARRLPGTDRRARRRAGGDVAPLGVPPARVTRPGSDDGDQKPVGRSPHDAVQVSPGSSQSSPSPLLNAFAGQVIGSIATARRDLVCLHRGSSAASRPAPSRTPRRPTAPGRCRPAPGAGARSVRR